MEDLTGKVTLDQLTAAEFIQPMSEIQKVITESGQTLTSTDVNQFYKAIGATVANKADALALELIDGKTVHITSQDGGLFIMRTGAPIGTYNDDGGAFLGTKATSGDGSSGIERDDALVRNLRWFGAVGDAVTSDSVAIQNAFNASAGFRLRVPTGIYLITDAVSLPDAITLMGDGTGSTFTLCTDVIIQRCTFTGNQGPTAYSSIALRSQGTVNFTVLNCRFSDYDSSVYLDLSGATHSDNVKVLDCYFEQTIDGPSDNPTAVYQFNCVNLLVDGCTFKDIRAGGGTPIAGYSVYEGDGIATNLVVTNCVSTQSVAGFPHVQVQCSNATNCTVTNNHLISVPNVRNQLFNGGGENASIFIQNNYTENASIFIGRAGGVATAPSLVVIESNHFNKMEFDDIVIFLGVLSTNYVQTARIQNNLIFGCNRGAIYVGQCEYVDISKNKFWNVNTQNNVAGANQLQDAIAFEQVNPIRGIVADNEFLNDTTAPQGFGRHSVSAISTLNNTVTVINNQSSGMTGTNVLNLFEAGFVPNYGANTITLKSNTLDIADDGIFGGNVFSSAGAANGFSVGGRARLNGVERSLINTVATVISQSGGGLSEGSFSVISGSLSGTPATKFIDVVLWIASGGAPSVIANQDSGTPSARTYTVSGNSLQLAMASGSYQVAAGQLSVSS